MLFTVLKAGVAAFVIVFASWLAGKKPELAGFITALPLVSIMRLPLLIRNMVMWATQPNMHEVLSLPCQSHGCSFYRFSSPRNLILDFGSVGFWGLHYW